MSGETAARSVGVVTTLRSVLFSVWMYGLGLILGVLCLPVLLGDRRGAHAAIRFWCRLVLWGLKAMVGGRIEVVGDAPSGPALIAAKHQGMLDIIPPFAYLPDPCFVLKKELLRIPIFGWYAAKAGMIAIDREGAAKSLRALVNDAKEALAAGRQVIIFPEGTRQAPGSEPDYKPGVAGLYRELGVACTPLATNSGCIWPAHGMAKHAGVATFQLLEPIPPGLKRATFMAILEDRIEAASSQLLLKDQPGRS